jgi:putative transposase
LGYFNLIFPIPVKPRIGAHGALHRIMARKIEVGKIYRDDKDRDHFLERLENILKDTETSCYTWALIPNHFHEEK